MLVRLSRATGLAASFKIPQTITFSQYVKEADAGWCDRGHGLKFGQPRETEGGSSKVWSGNVGEKSLIVVKNEWLGQSWDLITHWWQLIIEERRED